MLQLRKNHLLFAILACLFIFCFDAAAIRYTPFQHDIQWLSIGIALDFVLVIPLLLYFLALRKHKKSVLWIIPFALAGYAALHAVLPASAQPILTFLMYALIPLELLFLGYETVKLVQFIRRFKARRIHGAAPLDTIRQSVASELGSSKWTALLSHDVSVFYLAFLAWRNSPYVRTNSVAFTTHIHSNYFIIVLVLSKILLIEGIAIHLLLMHWSHLAAWLISLGNVYLIALLLADYRALQLNPILVSNEGLHIQYGLQLSVDLQQQQIESISVVSPASLDKNELNAAFTPIAVEPNVRICLTAKTAISGWFGVQRKVDRLYLHIDRPHEFARAWPYELNSS
ncbi:hypothetical protein [Paenibacillus sp. y28]|uniref:hypothetical protein n=1 Tax=Paenibacillus sp. y28 TaxID=3129110 RepID=UPI00301A392E